MELSLSYIGDFELKFWIMLKLLKSWVLSSVETVCTVKQIWALKAHAYNFMFGFEVSSL